VSFCSANCNATYVCNESTMRIPEERIPNNALVLQNGVHRSTHVYLYMRVYPKVSGVATWSENCKWCSSLALGAVVSLFCESV
jgi:hypothetical protein